MKSRKVAGSFFDHMDSKGGMKSGKVVDPFFDHVDPKGGCIPH